jgi:methyl-accepting chemotaxis protein
VQALRKPSVPAWAVNQLARRHPRELAALAAAGERLTRAQQDVLGGGDRSEFDRAGADQREAVTLLMELARELLAEAGNAASDQTLERVASTLRAASMDPPARAAMLAGVLEEEVAPGGFEQIAGLSASGAASARSARGATRRQEEASRRREELAEARQALKDARAAERELTAAAREAEDEARKARTAAERVEREAEKALARVAEAAERTAEAASTLEELEKAPRRDAHGARGSKPAPARRRSS